MAIVSLPYCYSITIESQQCLGEVASSVAVILWQLNASLREILLADNKETDQN
ncbi:unnamed protein product, partial [Nesidiocoris tenuis]